MGRAGSSGDLSPGCVDGRLFPVSSRGRPSVCVCVLISSYKDPSAMESGPTLTTSLEILSPNTGAFLNTGGEGFTYGFWEDTIQSISEVMPTSGLLGQK